MLIYIIIAAFVAIIVMLTWFFLKNDHGDKEPVSALWIAGLLGVLGFVAAGFLEYWFIPLKSLTLGTSSYKSAFLAFLLVGLIEESCKFIPLAIFIFKRSYFNEHTDGIIYFALAGLGFGIPENIFYTIQYGSNAGALRLVMTPIFHAATVGLVGYFLIKVKIDHKGWWTVLLALMSAMLLHGLYDFSLTTGMILLVVLALGITFTVSAMLFVLFFRAGEIDREQGLSVVGKNDFCRSCGAPNPDHDIHCEKCGKIA